MITETDSVVRYKTRGRWDRGRPWKRWNEFAKSKQLDYLYHEVEEDSCGQKAFRSVQDFLEEFKLV